MVIPSSVWQARAEDGCCALGMSGLVHIRWVDLWMIVPTTTGGRILNFNVPQPRPVPVILFVTGLKVDNRLCSLQHTAPKIEISTPSFRSQWGSFILLTFVVSWVSCVFSERSGGPISLSTLHTLPYFRAGSTSGILILVWVRLRGPHLRKFECCEDIPPCLHCSVASTSLGF